jgi:tRNA pseudouridine38-40 synthase
MQESAGILLGRNDFAAFTANPNRHVPSTHRTLRKLEVRRKGKEVVLIAESEGFLYKMVRSLSGFLIRVGQGEVSSGDTGKILNSKTRTACVPTAPPEGLWLWKVFYGK